MSGNPELLATMAVIAAGAMLGRIRVYGVRLDVAAMLLLGAIVAHFGVILSPALGMFGLLLFLYAMGVQAGPAVRGMQRRELQLAGIGVAAGLSIAAGTVVAAWALNLPLAVGLGSFFGFCGSGAALALLETEKPRGAAAGFAVAAPVGATLVMLLVQGLRARFKDRISEELSSWNRDMVRSREEPMNATIIVEHDAIAECSLRSLRPPCQVLWVERDGESFAAEADTFLRRGDRMHVSGTKESIGAAAALFGTLLPCEPRQDGPISIRSFFVSNSSAIGVRIDHMHLRDRFGATITRVHRASITLRTRPGLRFRWGDRVRVSVPTQHVEELRQLFGDDARGLEEFAFPRAALVIFAGGLLGAAPIHLGDLARLRVGPAVGVLAVSMFTAALHRTGPLIWSQSAPTLRTLSHIGLPLFLAQVGNASYEGLSSSWSEYGALLVVVAVVPVVLLAMLGLIAGRFWKTGHLTLLSLIASLAMNTPALIAIQAKYRERIPSHVYAAVYPFAVLMVLSLALAVSLTSELMAGK